MARGFFFFMCFFFFSSRRRHTRCSRDWSSDVCSSDLRVARELGDREGLRHGGPGRRRKGDRIHRHATRGERYESFWGRDGRKCPGPTRSEERRVGKEGRWGWWG